MVNGQDEGDPMDPESMALGQLRRRYDELRADYEALLARLEDLESLDETGPAEPVEPGSMPASLLFGLREQVVAPLLALRDEYADAQATLEQLINGLDVLTTRGLKGQRSAEPELEPASLEVRVRGRSPGQLLGFRERLAGMEGVARVNIHAVDPERAVLIVELEGSN
ncbi:MAG: hypothetical protein R3B97_14150 [Dehalococcoidia bacterium]|nr:hypothetical protein [Dehalococcoidia bacterium]MCB9486004.1 hypothetical protein [Thermoflexaceae bacterium]